MNEIHLLILGLSLGREALVGAISALPSNLLVQVGTPFTGMSFEHLDLVPGKIVFLVPAGLKHWTDSS